MEGQIGTPAEAGHTSDAFPLEEIGDLARTPSETAEAEDIYAIDLSEAKLIRAAYIKMGYDAAKVDRALGPLEEWQ